MALELLPTKVPSLAAGLVMLGLAVFVFARDPSRRLVQAFALMVFLKAASLLVFAFSGQYVALDQLGSYIDIAQPPSILYFAWVFYHHHRRPAATAGRLLGPWVPWFLLGATVVMEALFVRWHSLMGYFDPATGSYVAGWLEPVGPLERFSYVVVLAMCIVEWSRADVMRRTWFRTALAFLLVPAYEAVAYLCDEMLGWMRVGARPEIFQLRGYQGPTVVQIVIRSLTLLGLVAVWVYARWSARSKSDEARMEARILAWSLAVVAATAVAARAVWTYQLVARWDWPHIILVGVWALAMAILLIGPATQGRILEADWVVRMTIQRATLVSIFVAVAFVTIELTANYLTQLQSVSVGTAAAGVLLFALHPLQRLADRVSNSVVPTGKAVGEMTHPERLRIYREQAELAWMDGALQKKERLLLDRLRERLGLSLSEAAQIERESLA